LETMLASYPFHATVFVSPPCEAIYANDAERGQSFAEAVDVPATIIRWYRWCGYALHEVPRLPVAQRPSMCCAFSRRAPRNPSLHLMRYCWLRQPSRPGELNN
jgi:predicted ATPase